MNYIPGFSNYLQASVPAYANGGAVMDDPRQAAVMPMTQEGVPLSYEELADRRAVANTLPIGTSIVGPYAGKKGLSFGADNTFDVGADEEVRLVDAGGNVIVSGSGVEGANRAVAAAQSLSDDLGKNANFKIQLGERTINPDGTVGGTRYIDVARAAPSQSGLGFLADNVLPFAASFIPGIGPIAGAALGSAVSSGLQGRSLQDALVRAAIAGGSAYAGSQLFGPATPGASAPMTGPNADLIPNALKGLNFGSLTSAAIPAAVGGAASPIIVNAAGRAASNLAGSAVGGALGQAAASQIGAPKQGNVVDGVDQDTGDIVVSKYRPISPPGGYAPIPILGATAFPTGSILDSLGPLNTLPSDPALMQPETLPEDIVVTGMESLTPDEILLALGGVGGLAAATAGGAATDPAAAEKAKADAETKKKLGLEEYLRIAGLASGLIGGAAGGGSGGSGTYGGSGTGRLNPIFSAKLPSAGGLGSIGMNRTQRPMGDVDWLTYGTRPELSFFDYAPRTALPTPAALPTPVTQPVPNNPAGPIMAERDPMRFAKGGRSEFAVNGAGTGRSDDIPAVLSDGEYVIDAETVALLGDGSNKAGAKKLDELRVKVRKHKGQKLAKGRFSANAKKPEAYLSGGRI